MIEYILRIPWHVPFGEFSLRLDPLNVIFLAAVIILVTCAGIYGIGYMRKYKGKKPLGLHWFFYGLLCAALVLIITANNVILFLGAWEVMAIATYFLIVFQDEELSVRRAGFIYLVATHCGTFCLFLMFFLLAHAAGSMDFGVIAATKLSPLLAGTVFSLAIIGFGVKAGLMPMHLWLPHAHPAAPAHVSALMSGVAIKTGIYGICRVLWMVGILPDWCGYALLSIGIVSGVMGVLYALGQHELKKLLAYHSIENIGIIAVGLGVGLIGRAQHLPFLAVLGFGGALLHVVNHSLFKGLLFLGAGAVIKQTHTGEMDRMGGLAKPMPVTGALFLVGALAICGLPLFNGFISEFIIYYGLFQGLFNLSLPGVFSCAVGILALALMGALALACFTKVYGTVFCGQPRDPEISVKREELVPSMAGPMIVLAGLCVWIGLAPRFAAGMVFSGGEYLARAGTAAVDPDRILIPLSAVIGGAFVFCALAAVLAAIRRMLLKPAPAQDTWSCGFSRVTPRFQYTSSSFARPIVEFVKGLLLFHRQGGKIEGAFPGKSQMSSSVHDAVEENLFRLLFVRFTDISRKFDAKRIRYTQVYLLYIFLFLIFLLVWKLR